MSGSTHLLIGQTTSTNTPFWAVTAIMVLVLMAGILLTVWTRRNRRNASDAAETVDPAIAVNEIPGDEAPKAVFASSLPYSEKEVGMTQRAQ